MNSTIVSTTVAAMMALFGMGPHAAPVKAPVAMVWTQDAPAVAPLADAAMVRK